MILLYSASGLYHAVRLPPDELGFFQLLDMSAIYLMIAGSVTPVIFVLTRGRFRTALLVGQWSFAFGVCAVAFPAARPRVMIACYFAMAWLGCAGLWQYYRAVGWTGSALVRRLDRDLQARSALPSCSTGRDLARRHSSARASSLLRYRRNRMLPRVSCEIRPSIRACRIRAAECKRNSRRNSRLAQA